MQDEDWWAGMWAWLDAEKRQAAVTAADAKWEARLTTLPRTLLAEAEAKTARALGIDEVMTAPQEGTIGQLQARHDGHLVVTLAPQLTAAQRVRVLSHELGHLKAGHLTDPAAIAVRQAVQAKEPKPTGWQHAGFLLREVEASTMGQAILEVLWPLFEREAPEFRRNEALVEPRKAEERRRWLADHPSEDAETFERRAWPQLRLNLVEALKRDRQQEQEQALRRGLGGVRYSF